MDTTTFIKIKTLLIENGYSLMDGYPTPNGTETVFRKDNVDVIIKEITHIDNLS